ncbi:hypothetical protein FGG08_004942 [Glutinoglossum americanum]|uniref:Major facilitator superfamily (MFS) profile domain-containing protein n=1 Tax=Glutinoglossum americanum TaxID=1670608 RepID=A0A9P8I6H9_9PEZI|nr:hypothetical protein FGG08_004942 [Glutinoglossum americanum]
MEIVQIVVAPACAVMVLSVMMTSLCTQYSQFILAQGVLGGMACGVIFTPAISVVGQYFSRHRAFAMGIASSGAPAGGVLFPIVLNRLLSFPNLGFGWTVRVVGFIMLALLACTSILLTEIAPRRKGQFFTPSAFKNSTYIAINVASFMAMLGLFTPLFYISDYSVQHGMSLQLATYQISILNCASIFGRLFLGYVADRIGHYNAMFLSMASSAILIFCWTSTDSVASITVFSAFYGFFSGTIISLYPPCVAQIAPSLSHIATYVGMGMATVSLGSLAGTPINGVLVHTYHSYTQVAIFSGVVMVAGASLIIVARLTIKRELMAVI